MHNVTRLTFSPGFEEALAREQQARLSAELHRRRTEIAAFQARYPPLPDLEALPELNWAAVRRQLEELAWTRQSRSMVHPLLEDLKTRATWQTPEMVARGLILLAGMVMEERGASEPAHEPGEAPMS